MAKKVRDYQAEYRRRIERATAQGKTRAQARGHGNKTREKTAAQTRAARIKETYGVSPTTRNRLKQAERESVKRNSIHRDTVDDYLLQGYSPDVIRHIVYAQDEAAQLHNAGYSPGSRRIMRDLKEWLTKRGINLSNNDPAFYYHA